MLCERFTAGPAFSLHPLQDHITLGALGRRVWREAALHIRGGQARPQHCPQLRHCLRVVLQYLACRSIQCKRIKSS